MVDKLYFSDTTLESQGNMPASSVSREGPVSASNGCLGYCILQRGRILSSSGRRYKDTKPQSLSVKPSHKCINLFMKEKHSGSSYFLKTLHPSILSCWQDLTFRMDQTPAERMLMKHCAEYWVRVQSTRHHVSLSSFSLVLNV